MINNFIPPFIMREVGLEVHDTPKIHVTDPTTNHHAIIFGADFKIQLGIWGIFSCFDTNTPRKQLLEEFEDVYSLTPEYNCDPHSDVYARNEKNMLDWEGNMIEGKKLCEDSTFQYTR